ncbi:MAG: hypothetical protein Q4D90_03345 [bacterium]|nr:hypothetical protein [bacterium]
MEASLAFVLFLFAVIAMLLPMRMVQVKRQVRAAMEAANEELCQLAYEGDWSWLESEAAKWYVKAKVMGISEKDAIEELSVAESKILEDGKHIDLRVRYRMKIPFSVWKLGSLPVTVRNYKRAWVGKSGKEAEEGGKREAGKGEGDKTTVYVGNKKSRFHWYRDCHYLSNESDAVKYSEISTQKNRFGRHYSPCKRCCNNVGGEQDLVYIFEGGESYHSTRNCSSLYAYVEEAEWKDVSNLGECSYCARRRDAE